MAGRGGVVTLGRCKSHASLYPNSVSIFLCGLGIISQAGKKSLLPVTQEARTTSLPTPSHPIVGGCGC